MSKLDYEYYNMLYNKAKDIYPYSIYRLIKRAEELETILSLTKSLILELEQECVELGHIPSHYNVWFILRDKINKLRSDDE